SCSRSPDRDVTPVDPVPCRTNATYPPVATISPTTTPITAARPRFPITGTMLRRRSEQRAPDEHVGTTVGVAGDQVGGLAVVDHESAVRGDRGILARRVALSARGGHVDPERPVCGPIPEEHVDVAVRDRAT